MKIKQLDIYKKIRKPFPPATKIIKSKKDKVKNKRLQKYFDTMGDMC